MTSAFPDFARMGFDAAAPSASALARRSTSPASQGRKSWLTPEGIEVPTAYSQEQLDFVAGYPGLAPFVRGPYPTMYVTNPWTIRQYAGFSTAEESNAFYRRNSRPGRWGCRWPSTWPPTAATIPTTNG